MHQLQLGRLVICRSQARVFQYSFVIERSRRFRHSVPLRPQCSSSPTSAPRQFRLASPRKRRHRSENAKHQPANEETKARSQAFGQLEQLLKAFDAQPRGSLDAAPLEELLQALMPQEGATGALENATPLSDLDGQPAYETLKASVAGSSDAERFALLQYIKEEYEAKASQIKQNLPPDQQQEAERQLGPDWDKADFVDEVLNVRPDPGAAEAISAAIMNVFDDEELDFMHRFTGINWRHLETYTAQDWRSPQESVDNMSQDDLLFLSKVAEKMDAVNRRLEEAKQEKRRTQRQAAVTSDQGDPQASPSGSEASSSGSGSTSKRGRYSRRSSSKRRVQGARVAEPTGDQSSSWGERGSGDASTSDGAWRELFPDVGDEEFRRHFDTMAMFQQQAQAGTLFEDERSKHLQQLAWIYTELEGLAAVSDPLGVGLTEEEYRAKFEVVAFRLSELMDALARGSISDMAAASVVRYLDTQLVDLSGDESGVMFLQAEPQDVHRLGRMMCAAENLMVLRDFTRAYAAAASDPSAQQVAEQFQEFCGESWWVKAEDALTYEERQLYRVRRHASCPVPDWSKIDLLAELDTDLLRFSRDASASRTPDEVFAKWYWHPVVGRRMVDGSLMSEGMPRIWQALYALVESGGQPEDAAAAFDAAVDRVTGGPDLEYMDDQGKWRGMAGRAARAGSART